MLEQAVHASLMSSAWKWQFNMIFPKARSTLPQVGLDKHCNHSFEILLKKDGFTLQICFMNDDSSESWLPVEACIQHWISPSHNPDKTCPSKAKLPARYPRAVTTCTASRSCPLPPAGIQAAQKMSLIDRDMEASKTDQCKAVRHTFKL